MTSFGVGGVHPPARRSECGGQGPGTGPRPGLGSPPRLNPTPNTQPHPVSTTRSTAHRHSHLSPLVDHTQHIVMNEAGRTSPEPSAPLIGLPSEPHLGEGDDLTDALNLLSISNQPSQPIPVTTSHLNSPLTTFSLMSTSSSASSSRARAPAPISLLAASTATPPPLSSPHSDSHPHSIVSPAPPTRRTCVIFQDACNGHLYTRDRAVDGIVERPERVRAVKTGVAAAWARLEARAKRLDGGVETSVRAGDNQLGTSELDQLMGKLDIAGSGTQASLNQAEDRSIKGGPFDIFFSTAKLSPNDKALALVHPDPNLAPRTPPLPPQPSQPDPAPATPGRKPPRDRTPGNTPAKQLDPAIDASSNPSYSTQSTAPAPKLAPHPTAMNPHSPWPNQLQKLCQRSDEAHKVAPFSEIPAHLSQTDLYLSPGSEGAIFGALGAVCEGVDRVVQGARSGGAGYDRAFVAIRPPGHVSRPLFECLIRVVVLS